MGTSPRLPLNDVYRGFYELLAAAMSAALATIGAREDERRRIEALAAIDRAKTAFFSNVSHEFRTPLTLMLGPIEDVLAEPNTLSPTQRDWLHVIHRNARRLLRLVNTLLDFSRIEAGRVQAHFEPADLATITAELASNFDSACARADLSLSMDCPPLSRPVHVDRDMWKKIVLNLISNAFKFTLAGGISVSLHDVGAGVRLTVRDTGVGIPAPELPRVFERFHRIENQRGRSHEGTGIGLALVQELVALQGGQINVESVADEGSVFCVTLPFGTAHLPAEHRASTEVADRRAAASAALPANAFVEEALRWLPDQPAADDAGSATAPNAEPVNPEQASPIPGSSGRMEEKPRILIADDNADMRAYIRRILQDGGYAVEAVADGAAALAAVRRHPQPDLVLSDVMMPGLDGFQLLQALRGDPVMEGMLVILLSARAGEEARVEGLTAGADDYLVKPFSARELRARVDGAIRLSRQRREAEARERTLQTSLATARSQAHLHETEQRLELALKAGRLGSWDLDLVTGSLVASDVFRANFGWAPCEPYDYQRVQAAIDPADRGRHRRSIAAAIADRSALDLEYRVIRPGGEAAWILSRGHAIYGQDGEPLRLAGVSLDITDRKRAEERQRLLLDELNHRVKNTLASVQSIAVQTRRTAQDPAAFGEAFEARIGALAQAHDLLTRAGWDGTMLADIVALTLAPYARTTDGQERVDIAGPPIHLGPNASVTMNMAFHELATNAAKYGAFSIDGGRVAVRWSVDRSIEPPMLAIDWTECDGPPVVPPHRPGFGSRLLRSGVPRELGGSVAIDFAPAGVAWHMRLALSNKVAVAD